MDTIATFAILLSVKGATSVTPWALDAAMFILRIVCGTFFLCSGYHKLFNRARHARLVQTLKDDKVPALWFNQWWVPFWEFTGGLLVLLGLAAPFAAGVLLIICLVACACEAPKRVDSYQPIDRADRVDDWLYLPEVLYCVMLLAVMVVGPGRFSLIH